MVGKWTTILLGLLSILAFAQSRRRDDEPESSEFAGHKPRFDSASSEQFRGHQRDDEPTRIDFRSDRKQPNPDVDLGPEDLTALCSKVDKNYKHIEDTCFTWVPCEEDSSIKPDPCCCCNTRRPCGYYKQELCKNKRQREKREATGFSSLFQEQIFLASH